MPRETSVAIGDLFRGFSGIQQQDATHPLLPQIGGALKEVQLRDP